jgi:Amt family ammonium transporter
MINSGDTAFVLICSALVMIMTPGLALFYGGMVRRKNILGVLIQCFMALCILSIQWVLVGYTLSFGQSGGFFTGGLGWLGLNGVGLEPFEKFSATIPHQAFMIFQAMFAIITPALIIGAFVERMKFSAYIIFTLLWATFVYDPICHWVWGGGFLGKMGALDFAGGTVVHINAGIAALVLAIGLGKRKKFDFAKRSIPPHNLPMTVIGTALLWFGWFGFNAGSALGANGIAVNAFVVTNTAAAAAGLMWAGIEWMIHGRPTMLGTVSGAVAGLVAITPAAGFVSVIPAIIIGIVAAGICYVFVTVIKPKLGYDDSLDAFGVHGIGGIVGALLTGVFASKLINPAGNDGLLFGNPAQFLIQAKATLVTVVYSTIMTIIIFKVVDLLVGMRVSDKEESMGLDLSQHRESAYTVLE